MHPNVPGQTQKPRSGHGVGRHPWYCSALALLFTVPLLLAYGATTRGLTSPTGTAIGSTVAPETAGAPAVSRVGRAVAPETVGISAPSTAQDTAAPLPATPLPPAPAATPQIVFEATPVFTPLPQTSPMVQPSMATPHPPASRRVRIMNSASGAALINLDLKIAGTSAHTDDHGDVLLPLDAAANPAELPGFEQIPAPIGQISLRPNAMQTARLFLQDLQSGHPEQTWGDLTPDTQSAWKSAEQYAAFYRNKFGTTPIEAFELGEPSAPAAWSRPTTDAHYTRAITIPLTLHVRSSSAKTGRDVLGPDMLLVDDGQRWTIASSGAAGSEGTLLLPPVLPSRALNVPILMYHHIAPTPVRGQFRADFDFRLAYDLTVNPEDFNRQLDYLVKAGYHGVTPHAVLNALLYGTPLPEKAVVLTFDDGYLDNYTYAFPLLAQHGMVGTFSVIVGLIGQHGPDLQYMGWDALQTMVDQGMDIQSHTQNHRDLGTLSDDAAFQELTLSLQALQQRFHLPVDILTYPSGEPFRSGNVARQQTLLSLLPRAGYGGALLDPILSSTRQDAQRPYQLQRVRVPGNGRLDSFVASLGTQRRIADAER